MLYFRPQNSIIRGEFRRDYAILCRDSRIVEVGPAATLPCPEGARALDTTSLTAVPGFIDLQFNGGFGFHFTDAPETIWEAGALLPRYGVTRFLPTIITSPPTQTDRALAVWAKGPPPDYRGAVPIGLHFEGPFLSPEKVGVHDPRWLRPIPAPDELSWSRQRGVALVTLAPELDGATALIESLVANGVVAAAGHTAASFEDGVLGFEAGIRYVTHLFNAMSPFHHRSSGLVGAALDRDDVTVGVIPDGVHLSEEVVRLIYRCMGASRTSVVTDATIAAGLEPGDYSMAGRALTVDETSARTREGTLAGSVLMLDQALRNMVKFTGSPLVDVLPTVTTTPADLLGHDGGELAPGRPADIAFLDADMYVCLTVVDGVVSFDSRT